MNPDDLPQVKSSFKRKAFFIVVTLFVLFLIGAKQKKNNENISPTAK